MIATTAQLYSNVALGPDAEVQEFVLVGVPPRGREPGEPLKEAAQTFLESIHTGTLPQSDGRDGLRVVRVLEAAQELILTEG